MTREESFDSFYLATRRALVHQTFALTGDLPAARGAVRDAYVAAWHHWRKAASGDPMDWVRPRAWQLAQRRHTGRIWHRNKGLSEEQTAVLEAVAGLPSLQRRTLLLVQLAGLDLPHAAREIGITLGAAEQHLQSATAGLAVALDADSTAIRQRLDLLAGPAGQAPLPRASIVRRAGKKRRQAHTLVAVAAAAVVAIASGAVAYEPADSGAAAPPPHLVRPAKKQPVAAAGQDPQPEAAQLLDQDQIARLGLSQEWTVTRTDDNTAGEGINTVCQQSRFADPDGLSALVRTFSASGRPKRSAVQTVEVSRSTKQAERAFDTTVGWYAGCQVGRLQLLKAYRADGIGDEAHVLVIRQWTKPVTTYSVAVARIGRVTTSTVAKNAGAGTAPPGQITQSLADAVSMLCATSGAEGCARQPSYQAVPPPPSGDEPGILAAVDLPPVGSIDQPWVGTTPRAVRTNPSQTTCDRADFVESGARTSRSRSFLMPHARVPARFGLSETYGVFGSAADARSFMRQVRRNVAGCEKRDLSTTVGAERDAQVNGLDLSTWQLTTDVSDNETIEFRVGFVRYGNAVAELNFSPTARDDMTGRDFLALVGRAGDRLRELGGS